MEDNQITFFRPNASSVISDYDYKRNTIWETEVFEKIRVSSNFMMGKMVITQ